MKMILSMKLTRSYDLVVDDPGDLTENLDRSMPDINPPIGIDEHFGDVVQLAVLQGFDSVSPISSLPKDVAAIFHRETIHHHLTHEFYLVIAHTFASSATSIAYKCIASIDFELTRCLTFSHGCRTFACTAPKTVSNCLLASFVSRPC